jgi:aerobic C4-dicarboxylate transport protein
VPTIHVAGMALILGIDRFMSECRALTNFIGNGVATVVVSHWEKELDRNQMEKELASPSHNQAPALAAAA